MTASTGSSILQTCRKKSEDGSRKTPPTMPPSMAAQGSRIAQPLVMTMHPIRAPLPADIKSLHSHRTHTHSSPFNIRLSAAWQRGRYTLQFPLAIERKPAQLRRPVLLHPPGLHPNTSMKPCPLYQCNTWTVYCMVIDGTPDCMASGDLGVGHIDQEGSHAAKACSEGCADSTASHHLSHGTSAIRRLL